MDAVARGARPAAPRGARGARRATSAPSDVEAALGAQPRPGSPTLHSSPELTILHVVWPPGMALFPHDHRMWAAIGVYGGQEDNAFFRRGDAPGSWRRADGSCASTRSCCWATTPFTRVTNPQQHAFTGAIHVYGGDFFAAPRSAWTPDTLTEHAYDPDEAMEAFRVADEAWLARSSVDAGRADPGGAGR